MALKLAMVIAVALAAATGPPSAFAQDGRVGATAKSPPAAPATAPPAAPAAAPATASRTAPLLAQDAGPNLTSQAHLSLPAAAAEHQGAAALGLGLRRLGHTKRVLMIGAHPDDEDTSLLAALGLGQGAEVAYLSLTRGEGGQNGIGPELQEALGLIRSEELLAARRLDGAAQFFTSAYDFGYSRSLDETLRHWPRELLLADVVAVVRAWRPDIVLSVFSGTPRDGHGQHQAAGVMAREAYEIAGDPTRFPEQIAAGLSPHEPVKLYRSSWFRPEEATLRLPTGTYDPLLGRSHFQVAMASRSRHRSQDMGRIELAGPRWGHVQRLAARTGPADPDAEASIWEGVDTTMTARIRGLSEVVRTGRGENADGSPEQSGAAERVLADYEALAAELRNAWNPLHPERLVSGLARALAQLNAADSLVAAKRGGDASRLRFDLAVQRRAAATALARAAGLELDVVAGAERLVPGEPFELELMLWNGGKLDIEVCEVAPALPPGWAAELVDGEPPALLAAGEAVVLSYRAVPPPDAAPTEPYFLRAPREGSMYVWPDTAVLGIPFQPRPVRGAARIAVAGAEVLLEREAEHREVDPRRGELRRPVRVVPAVAVAIDPAIRALPLEPANSALMAEPAGAAATAGGDPRPGVTASADTAAAGHVPGSARPPIDFELRVATASAAGARGVLRLDAPAGWHAEPAVLDLELEAGATRNVDVRLHPLADAAAGSYRLAARFEAEDGRTYARGYEVVDHDHIRPQPSYRDAAADIVAFDARVPAGLSVGYVLGAADRVPVALAQLGIDVLLLDEAALAAGDLGAFDAVVVGPRAYEVRPDLVAHNHRLLDYARAGGTMVVQYQQYAFVEGGYAPFPLTIARPHDRVTDHESPVRILEPGHRLLRTPNRISAADFEGWIQERGLYFASDWHEAFSPLLELEDPEREPVSGGLLVANYGDGIYVYTGLAFFRQLPAGVPGAHRLFVNLLSSGGRQQTAW